MSDKKQPKKSGREGNGGTAKILREKSREWKPLSPALSPQAGRERKGAASLHTVHEATRQNEEVCRALKGKSKNVIKTIIEAVGECQAKAEFDYQRIVVCLAVNLRECEELARQCRVGLSRVVMRKNSKRCGPVVVLEVGTLGERELLAAAVRAVNQQRAVVVLVATEEAFTNWHGRWRVEAGRIRRRTHVVLRGGK